MGVWGERGLSWTPSSSFSQSGGTNPPFPRFFFSLFFFFTVGIAPPAGAVFRKRSVGRVFPPPPLPLGASSRFSLFFFPPCHLRLPFSPPFPPGPAYFSEAGGSFPPWDRQEIPFPLHQGYFFPLIFGFLYSGRPNGRPKLFFLRYLNRSSFPSLSPLFLFPTPENVFPLFFLSLKNVADCFGLSRGFRIDFFFFPPVGGPFYSCGEVISSSAVFYEALFFPRTFSPFFFFEVAREWRGRPPPRQGWGPPCSTSRGYLLLVFLSFVARGIPVTMAWKLPLFFLQTPVPLPVQASPALKFFLTTDWARFLSLVTGLRVSRGGRNGPLLMGGLQLRQDNSFPGGHLPLLTQWRFS